MRALVFTTTEMLEHREAAPPMPAEGQSVVRVSRCGICGSDMHAWHGHDPRRVPPLVLGHEAVGIAETGPLAGRRVALNPLMTCGVCPACVAGREHLCPARELIGMRVPGAFAERVAIDSRNLTALSDSLPDERAVLAEPLAVAVHAVALGLARSPLLEGGPAVVLGGGAIGLLSALVLRARGIGDVRVAETVPQRRVALDRLLGAGASYDPRDVGAAPAEGTAPLVVDAVGSGVTRAAASKLAAPGGTIVHVGLQDGADGLDTRRLTLSEITFVGAYCYTRADFAEALALLEQGAVDPAGWCESLPLAEGQAAFRAIDGGAAPAKLVLVPGET